MLKLILLSSPSLTLSTPHSICFLTTCRTPSLRSASSLSLSYGLPSARAEICACSPSGRGRLPAWVVRIRSLLRFMAWSVGDGVTRSSHELAHETRGFLLVRLEL